MPPIGGGGKPTDPNGGTGTGGDTGTGGGTGAGGRTGGDGGGSGTGTGTGAGGGGTGTEGAGGSNPVQVTLSLGAEVPIAASIAQASADVGSSSGQGASGGVGGGDSSGFISVRSFGATTVPGGSLFSFTLPRDTFKHADPKATVVLEVRMADGKPLPDWLSFEPGTGRFTGRAPDGVQAIEVRVVARDTSGGEAATKVVLRFNAASEVK